jgi:membrane-bound serine protease (ClpP class)
MNKSRLIITIITNILWEAAIAGVAFGGLPFLGIRIPTWGIILIMIAFAVYAWIMYRIGSRTLGKRALPGSTDMIGVNGKVVKKLKPEGFIIIEGELWEAVAESGTIETGTEVTVIGQKGLKLLVKTL